MGFFANSFPKAPIAQLLILDNNLLDDGAVRWVVLRVSKGVLILPILDPCVDNGDEKNRHHVEDEIDYIVWEGIVVPQTVATVEIPAR